jgi:ABC-type lipoprotein release transport system permease subunit
MTNDQILDIFLVSGLTITFICAIIAIILGVYCLIELKAMKKSTHNIEYIPMDPNFASTDKEIEEVNERAEAEYPDWDIEDQNPADIDWTKMI